VLEFSVPTPAVASYAFAALAFAAFAARLALGYRGGAKAALLLAAAGLSALWAGLNLAVALGAPELIWRTQAAADALRMGGWILFVLLALGTARAHLAAALAIIAGAAALLALQPAPRVAFAVALALAIAGLVLTEQVFRRSADSARWALKPLCLALGGMFVFDLYVHADALLFGRLDADLWAARGLAQSLVIPFLAVASARNKDWTIEIAFSRGVVLHSTAFLACGIYLLAVAGAGYYVRYFGGSWGKTFQVGFIFAALLLLGWLFSSGALRAKVKVFINKHFFSYRYDYRQEWLRFTNHLSERAPELGMAQRSIEALANLVESPGGALWLREADGAFAESGRWNYPATTERIGAGAALPAFLAKTGWVIDVADYRRSAARYPGLDLPAWLAAPQAWLVVPLATHEELIGFVILAAARTRIELNWEVLDLLKTAARQVGGYLAQIQATEALLEARKFEAFNKMSAFVVHDLKNLIAQLALVLKNAERHRHNPRFQNDMLSTVQHVAERMSKLLTQLGAAGRDEERLRPLDLGALAERVVRAKAPERADIALRASAEVFALGHEQRLERVLGHLVQNAIDATRDGGGVGITVGAEDECAVLEVDDGGCGMSEAFVREQLFRPFQSTKAAGMGLGAYEAAQYMNELGGRIHAESRPGAGTRIRLLLPRCGEALAGARAMTHAA
jgi:putative PEP-CTERM system histidine kinase